MRYGLCHCSPGGCRGRRRKRGGRRQSQEMLRWRRHVRYVESEGISALHSVEIARLCTHLEVDAPGLDTGCDWHASRCCFHVLMAALVSSVRIGIHFSHERHCTRELSNRFTFGSDAKAALRSSTGRALLALQQTRKGTGSAWGMALSELEP